MAAGAPGLVERMAAVFGPGGVLSRVLERPEVRSGQIVMAEAVAEALGSGRYLAVEAGTGTGKSLAALVPAAMYALERRKRVVVATYTITLQEQLLKKDLPIVERILGPEADLRVALLKGRRNYVCRRKVAEAREFWYRFTFSSPAAAGVFKNLVTYVVEHDVGEREAIPFRLTDEVWEPIQSEADTCLGRRCPHFRSCHYFRAHRAACRARILVVNQALFFTDLAQKAAGEKGVLPRYDVAILDEAHHLEEVATAAWQVSINLAAFERVASAFRALARTIGAKRRGMDQVMQMAEGILGAGRRFLDELGEPRLVESPVGMTAGLRELLDLADVVKQRLDLIFSLHALGEGAKAARATAEVRLEELVAHARTWCQQSKQGFAYWVAVDRAGSLTAEMAPVDVGATLKVHLFHEKGPKVILMSATLHKALLQRCAFPAAEVRRVESPFRFQDQAILYTPPAQVALSPTSVTPERYEAYLAEQILRLCRITGGRALVLFTSWETMDRVYDRVAPQLSAWGQTPLKQGADESRGELLQRFRSDVHSCLFGLLSLWEGVDVPGEALSAVIITRLPFGVPTDPLSVARAQLMRKRGQDPFWEMALPEAIITFRQGFGRLIRTASDRGVVAVLDGRFLETEWGLEFRNAFAEVRGWRSLRRVAAVFADERVGAAG